MLVYCGFGKSSEYVNSSCISLIIEHSQISILLPQSYNFRRIKKFKISEIAIRNVSGCVKMAGSNISVSSATGAVTIAYTGGTGSMSSWTLAADSGSSQSITDGNTVTIQGSVQSSAKARSLRTHLVLRIGGCVLVPSSILASEITQRPTHRYPVPEP